MNHGTACPAVRHGTPTAYQAYGCRCPDAIAAQARYRKRLRHEKHSGRERRVDATGARRRIQALMAIGWSSREIMRRLGYSDGSVWLYYADHLNVATIEKIRALYEDLWDKPGPSKWTRTFAANRGFLPPLAWDEEAIDDPSASADLGGDGVDYDPVVVERLAAGADWTAIGATRPERLAAADLMQRWGHTLRHIEDHLSLRAGRDFRRGVAS